MHDLKALTALGGTTAQQDDFPGLRLSEAPDWALASLAARLGQEAEMAEKAQALLGTALPAAGGCVTHGAFTAFWTGPEQWMLMAPHDSHEDLAAQAKAALGTTASVTEQTDGWVRFDLEGARCHDVLERLCPVDTARMAAPAATRTRLEHLGCFLIRQGATRFTVLGPRSSAGSLHHALVTAAKSVI